LWPAGCYGDATYIREGLDLNKNAPLVVRPVTGKKPQKRQVKEAWRNMNTIIPYKTSGQRLPTNPEFKPKGPYE